MVGLRLALAFALSLQVIFLLTVRGARVNVTIDDTFPDPMTGHSIVYDPAMGWNDGRNCAGCTAHPSASDTFNGTWHDSTFKKDPKSTDFPNMVLSATAEFNGSAVYVFCILALSTSSPTGNSDMSFFLDDSLVGTFVKSAPGISGFDYNVVVYSNTSLRNGAHKLRIQNGHIGGTNTLLILDRVVYTTESDEGKTISNGSGNGNKDTQSNGSPTSSKNSVPVAAIAGGVVGGVIGILLAVIAFLLWRHRQGFKAQGTSPPVAEPFNVQPSTLVSPTSFYDAYPPNHQSMMPRWIAPSSSSDTSDTTNNTFAHALPKGKTAISRPYGNGLLSANTIGETSTSIAGPSVSNPPSDRSTFEDAPPAYMSDRPDASISPPPVERKTRPLPRPPAS